MKFSIILIIFLHFLNAINISYSKFIYKCNYIDNRTDSVNLNLYNVPYEVQETNSTIVNSTQNSDCYYDMFESDSMQNNRQNVKLLNMSETSFLFTYKSLEIFKNLTKLIMKTEGLTIYFYNFNDMPDLFEIDFSYNNFIYIQGIMSNKTTKLSIVNISHNSISHLYGNEFKGMTALKILDLSYNYINTIFTNPFENLINLKVLRLDNNPLIVFDPNIFLPTKRSTFLSVTFDSIEEFNCIECSMSIASNNSSEILIRLPGVKNELRYKKENMTNLLQISLTKTVIKNISEIIELLPSSLQTLSLSSCNLNGENINVLERLSSLEVLKLINSNLIDLEPSMFSRQNKLRIVDLSNNNLRIRNSTALFSPLENLDTIIISNVHLENITEFLESITPSVMSLDLSFNYLGKLNVTTFQRFNNLQYLNLSHTNLSNFGFSTFYHQTKLQSLDLSYNNLMKIDFRLFILSFRYTTELYLEGNNLSDVSTITPLIFPTLTELAISKNQLSCHSLAELMHQWKNLTIIRNPSNQTHMNGIDCNLDLVDVNTTDGTTKTDSIIVVHSESQITKYAVLFLCVICTGYIVVKLKPFKYIKEKLMNNSFASSVTYQQTISSAALIEAEI